MSNIQTVVTAMASAGCSADQIAAVVQAWGKGDEERLESKREWNALRQERYRQRRKLTPRQWESLREEVFARDGYACAYCGNADAVMHIDHVVPLIQGGTNDVVNLCVACGPCNMLKSGRTPEEMGWR